ncbi:hypothetical protein [Brevundimonas variabilis]|uniref:Uncharacterized protein n=1 Tax=Brevundimonas variabilis TaxID=74312 RepID=A0A7W9CJY4_9CAUL|nr:hypothetical protein [Brevundimonas variabilis]MBB5747065.1 hypothetical protein [Brevundimonas variabilis]
MISTPPHAPTRTSSTDFNFDHLDVRSLLRLHGRISQMLRDRGVTRTANNPTGDLAEHLFCKAFGWTQADNSMKAVDATCANGLRYQIKGRRTMQLKGSRQLSAIRDLEGDHFDVLAGVVFDEHFDVVRAALVPAALIRAGATYVKRTNSSKFILRDDVWTQPGVTDVTEALRAVEL